MKTPVLDTYKICVNHQPQLFQLYCNEDVPRPGATSRILAESVIGDLPTLRPRTALDLGCGVGLISLALKRAGVPDVHAADITNQAVQYAIVNSSVNHDYIAATQSDGFSAYSGRTFDLIVDDVSRIRNDIANFSSWFPLDTPSGGENGAEITASILRAAPCYLSEKGSIYFSISSLSDRNAIMNAAMDTYDCLEQKASKLIPLHGEFKQHLNALLELHNQEKILLLKKNGRLFWQFDVWRGYDPKN